MNRIIISRIDSIGDVMLTLPLAGFIKHHWPNATVLFLGRSYTRPVIDACKHVDEFMNWDEISASGNPAMAFEKVNADHIVHVFPNKEIAKAAKTAGIGTRIGTSRRWFHHLYCNVKPNLSRRRSKLHEAQLNIKLLQTVTDKTDCSLKEIRSYHGFEPTIELDGKWTSLLALHDKNVILHPKSQGSAREWGVENFNRLIELTKDQNIGVFITGTAKEGALLKHQINDSEDHVYNLTGQMNLTELISFISKCDVLVAASTGPLHIAAALGLHSIGLYSPVAPIFPQRWGAIGLRSINLTFNGSLEKGANAKNDRSIEKISAESVFDHMLSGPETEQPGSYNPVRGRL